MSPVRLAAKRDGRGETGHAPRKEGFAALRHDDVLDTGLSATDLLPALETVGQEVARLRKTLLKLGHGQELFQHRIEEEIGRLSRPLPGAEGALPGAAPTVPDRAQQRALMEVDQAVLHLLDLAQGAAREAPAAMEMAEAAPRSLREGLVLLQIRVRNLQRSFGLESIAAVGRLFDDRCHQACGVCERPGLADGEVAEEVLPGYRLGDRIVRPALVVVNRRNQSGKAPSRPPGEPDGEDPS